jgi:hypothetical protein
MVLSPLNTASLANDGLKDKDIAAPMSKVNGSTSSNSPTKAQQPPELQSQMPTPTQVSAWQTTGKKNKKRGKGSVGSSNIAGMDGERKGG